MSTTAEKSDARQPNVRLTSYLRYERELVVFVTRVPSGLFFELKKLVLMTTMQLLVEHAYTLYLGSRLPPDFWGGYEWPEEFPPEPKPAYLATRPRQLSVRMPRWLVRKIKIWALEADITDQELALKVFDWYVRTKRHPPSRAEAQRDRRGRLLVGEPLLADRFEPRTSSRQIMEALDVMVDRHTQFGGPLGSSSVSPVTSSPAGRRAEKRGHPTKPTR